MKCGPGEEEEEKEKKNSNNIFVKQSLEHNPSHVLLFLKVTYKKKKMAAMKGFKGGYYNKLLS